ncbi:MAG: Fur family ferric uptake transcriptional regulator [Kiritimatiellia bacterium]|jgi:Fur family ferric uptake transcriptional regulator
MSSRQRVELFREFLVGRGLKFTRQRDAISMVMFESDSHLTLNEILEAAKVRQPSVGYATVYRTMKLMSEAGLAHEHRFLDGYARYESATDEHHDHIICTLCGKIVEFEDHAIEELQSEVAIRLGFTVVGHRHEIYATCAPNCDDPPAHVTATGSPGHDFLS